MGSVGSTLKHGFEDIGNGIVHGAEAIGHVVKNAAEDVGGFVKDRAMNVYHAADDVVHGNFSGAASEIGDAATSTINDASHAFVTVGDTVAHVLHYVPIVGDTLSKGVLGVTDLTKVAGDAEKSVINDALHPLDTVRDFAHTITHPDSIMSNVMDGIHTVQRVSGDVNDIASAVGTVVPALAPELKGLSAVTGLIAHPSLSGVLDAATNLAPEGSTIAKAANYAQRAGNMVNDVRQVIAHPTLSGALSVASDMAPGNSRMAKIVHYGQRAEDVAGKVQNVIEHPTLSGALDVASDLAPKGSKMARVVHFGQRAEGVANKVQNVIEHPTFAGALDVASDVAPKGSKMARVVHFGQQANEIMEHPVSGALGVAAHYAPKNSTAAKVVHFGQRANNMLNRVHSMESRGNFVDFEPQFKSVGDFHRSLRATTDDVIGYYLMKNGQYTGSLYERGGKFLFIPPGEV